MRGIDFCRELTRTFNFHNYDNLVGGHHGKLDPRRRPEETRRNLVVDLCWAASRGDLDGLRRLVLEGADLNEPDYDGRTPLHLAASEGQHRIVSYMLRAGAFPDPKDRWGNTPTDDARRGGHERVLEALMEIDHAAA